MEIGWLDVCIRCGDLGKSLDFYQKLGFQQVEGNLTDGWAVMAQGSARIGLFNIEFMGEETFSLNFRGGNVPSIAEEISGSGISPVSQPKFKGNTGGSIRLRDPDGNLIFIDSFDGEKKVEPQ